MSILHFLLIDVNSNFSKKKQHQKVTEELQIFTCTMANSETSAPFTFDKEFHEIVSNKEVLAASTEKFLNNIIDEITLGIIFDLHRKYKTDSFSLDSDHSPSSEETLLNVEIFGQHKVNLLNR